MLAGALKPDGNQKVPEMKISMKPQTITPKFEGTVRQLFFKKIKAAFLSPQFQTDVVKPLKLDDFIDQEVKNLSGGELQRVCHRLISGASFGIFLTSTGGHCPRPRHAGRYLSHRRAFRL
jgi:ATP-binding cassette subfamily E protein 1